MEFPINSDINCGQTTLALAQRILDTQFENLEPAVVRSAQDIVLDAIANMLAGSREPMARTVIDALESIYGNTNGAGPGSTVVGTARKLPLLTAAYANAVLCHNMDFEMMWYPLTHPTSPTVPAFLVLAERVPMSGQDLIAAIVAAFEVQGRLRKAVVDGGLPHLYGLHPPGVVGCLGSAAGSAKLLGLDTRQSAMAISMACSRVSGVMVNTGTMTKASHSGNAARMGLECALLVKHGVTASLRGLEGHFGLSETLYENKLELCQLVRDYGNPFRMVDPGLAVKRFPSQYPTHWSIEAAIELKRQHRVSADDIAAVEIEVGDNNESAVRDWPQTGLEGKFCLKYGVAAALLDGTVTIKTFRDSRLNRADMAEIRPKISVLQRSDIDAMNFAIARSTVRVHTKSGKYLEASVERPRGIWDNPLNQAEREEKFADCAVAAGLDGTQQMLLLELIDKLPEIDDVAVLTHSLAVDRD